MIEFKKAERKKAKLRLGISAASGAGKTYSSLLIGRGLTTGYDKIALIDTENGSGELYSNLGDYAVAVIRPPFTPDKYIEAIKSAEQAGFEVIIIDSLSHAWTGEGGLLDMHDKITKASKSGNSYNAWREITPKHNQLIDTVLQSKCHMILTTRAKTEYVLQTDDKGRQVPKKMGMAPVFRDGLEYEMTVFFELSQEHIATASKDRTSLFDGKAFTPTVETGAALREWLENGTEIVKTAKETLIDMAKSDESVKETFRDILTNGYPGKKSADLTEEESAAILEQIKHSGNGGKK